MPNSPQKILLIVPQHVKPLPALRYNIWITPTPPLMLLSLANYLLEKNPDSEIKILDGQLMRLAEMLRKMEVYRPNLVGISPTVATYGNALILARKAKFLGAKVIFGGHYATSSADAILKNRGPQSGDYCIDAVVQQDGEEALWKLSRGAVNSRIPNLIWTSGKNLKGNKIVNHNLDKLPFLDFDLINLGDYYKEQASISFKSWPFSKVIAAYSRKGCGWRTASKGGCIFCSMMYNEVRLKSPERFLEELYFLKEEYKPNFIWDVADDFLDSPEWLKEFYYLARRRKVNVPLIIYSRVNRITEKTIHALRGLNVKAVSLGLESGENRILRHMKKGVLREDNLRACGLLAKAGITVVANFIFGGIGETRKTLKSNLKFLKGLKQKNPDIIFQLHLFQMIPGSGVWRILNQKTGNKYLYQDDPHSFYADSLNDWFKYFTGITVEEARRTMKEAETMLIPFKLFG
jgi:radical SAM superfamily enzyme YgiQ (UPF0313 family)